MPLTSKLDRKLSAAEESSDDDEYYEVTDRSSSPSVIDTGAGGEILDLGDGTDDEFDEDASMHEDDSDGEKGEDVQAEISRVSFGALAKAQDALSKNSTGEKHKRGTKSSKSQEEALQALRQRLQEIKAARLAQDGNPTRKSKSGKTRPADGSSLQGAGSDESESESDTAPHARSSKHAPAVQSSKRAVTRRRQVVDVKKPTFRDPRFDSVTGPKPDENTFKKRYGFLNEYKASEMAELRDAIKKTKNEADKEKLKKKLMSMESQQKAQQAKEKQQEIVREHKKKEKEQIKEGKKPFFLKKSEQKKLALVDRFQNMKSKDRDRAIERRRKKVTARERKKMPDERRGV